MEKERKSYMYRRSYVLRTEYSVCRTQLVGISIICMMYEKISTVSVNEAELLSYPFPTIEFVHLFI